MGFSLETALHVAVGNGNSTSFVSNLVAFISDDSLLAITDGLGYNPLHVAALTGNLHGARILLSRYPKLLYFSSRNNKIPVHLAAEFGHRETLELLLFHTKFDLETNPFAGDGGLLLLVLLIDADFFDMALNLVDKYPYLASTNHPLVGTALKKIALKATASAAKAHHNFLERLVYWCIKVEMKPQSFDIETQTCCTSTSTTLEPPRWRARLCNVLKYFVPPIKWIHEKRLMREQALRLVKCLCKHMESLKYEDAAAIYEDTMLTAAQSGIHDVVEVIVGTFPHAIHSRYSANQTFLHLAVRNRCEKVFNLMYQTNNYRYHYSDKIDSSGNSILHLAARLAPPNKLNLVSGAALQMQREIQWFQEAGKFVSPYTSGLPNYNGETAEMIFTEEHRNLKVEGEKWMKDTATSCTIAAALIATVVFAAAITVPGGNDSNSGYPVLSKSSAFTIFAAADAVSLFTSTTSLLMFLSILTSRYAEQDFLYALPKRLCIGLVTLFVSILFMMIAFSSTVYLVFGRKNAWVLIAVGALGCLPISSFVLLQFPLLTDVISSTYGRGIFGKQSDRPFP